MVKTTKMTKLCEIEKRTLYDCQFEKYVEKNDIQL